MIVHQVLACTICDARQPLCETSSTPCFGVDLPHGQGAMRTPLPEGGWYLRNNHFEVV